MIGRQLQTTLAICHILVVALFGQTVNAFVALPARQFSISISNNNNVNTVSPIMLAAASSGGGFGDSNSKKKTPTNKKMKKTKAPKGTIPPTPAAAATTKNPYVKSEQEDLLTELAQQASSTCIGRAVASAPPLPAGDEADPFWELMPSLINARFPKVADQQLERVAGVVRQALDPNLTLEDEIINNPHRPEQEIHAYMPGLGPTKPFHDPSQLALCKLMSDNYDAILSEYEALVDDMESGSGKDRFQSVTSMNYEGGWRTLVLFYNGHRIEGFPYHLCPTTTRILETVPLAGRIAGFNRQKPQTGIPLHTDGNNMWLTCQMGVKVPEGNAAYIRVGPETRRWETSKCLLYDTTYEHETFNEHDDQERVVLHVDFFNTLAMTPVEIEVMCYIYSLREEFMKAEGVTKVGAQIL